MTRQTKRTPHPGVASAISKAGSQQALAALLDCTQSAISKRLHGTVPISAEWAVEVERVLPGFSRKELRPDLWA
jgi:DNA-binding transcriptional regulator YdaS (Cro superfamily)